MKLTADGIRRYAIEVARERPEDFPSNAADYAEQILQTNGLQIHPRARLAVEEWISCIRDSVAGDKGEENTNARQFRATVVNALLTLDGDAERAALDMIRQTVKPAALRVGDIVINPITGRADRVVTIEEGQTGYAVTVASRHPGRIFWIARKETLDTFSI